MCGLRGRARKFSEVSVLVFELVGVYTSHCIGGLFRIVGLGYVG